MARMRRGRSSLEPWSRARHRRVRTRPADRRSGDLSSPGFTSERMSIDVYLEIGPRKTFACATDWPGWCRSGKGEDEALEALESYADRYAAVMRLARVSFRKPRGVDDLVVKARLTGNATTDFGVPGITPPADEQPISPAELDRLRRVLEASWKAFDAAARAGEGKELRLGPRGGGRSLAKIIDHVMEAEAAYVRQLGSRPLSANQGDRPAIVRKARKHALAALSTSAAGDPLPDPVNVKRPWTARYFVRRASWHVLD